MSNTRTVEVENSGIPWWLVLIQGIAAIILGILLFTRPVATTIIVIQFLGIYWLITGILSIISLLWDRTAWGWKLFSGILGVLAGLFIIENPLWSTLLVPTTLAWVLGFTGILMGIIQLIQAFRGAGWGAGILGGLSILLGILLIAHPVIAGFSLPWILGGLLVFGGILTIFAAFSLRRVEKQPEAAGSKSINQTSTSQVATKATAETAPTTAAEAAVARAAAESAASAATAVITKEFSEEDELGGVEEDPGEVAEFKLTGNVDPNDPEEMAKFKNSLEYVEGIGPVYGDRLKAIGLVNCLDLLQSGASRKGREIIAEKSGISGKLILEWVNQVDLYRIKGVGSEYADLLEAAGVDTVLELAQRNPTNLFEKLVVVNTEKELVRKMPTPSQVNDWIYQAKGLPRIVTY